MRFAESLFLVLLTLILSALPDHTFANAVNDPGVTPESSAIDTSRMRVGTSVVIVYGLGIADPTTGEWPKLVTATGTIQAINEQRLLLAQEGLDLPQRIELQRIQRLAVPDLHAAQLHSGGVKKMESESERADQPGQIPLRERTTERPGMRVAGKLIRGVLTGYLVSIPGRAIGGQLDPPCSEGGVPCPWFWQDGSTMGGAIAYSVGTAFAVSSKDPQDRFICALFGSLAGLGGSIWYTSHGEFWPSLFIFPLLSGVLASEWSRDRPAATPLSVSLMPDHRGRLPLAVRLHF